jgi:proton glutamate symport protein
MIPANPIAALAEAISCRSSRSVCCSASSLQVGGRPARGAEGVFRSGPGGDDAHDRWPIIRLCPAGVLLLMLYVTATQGWDVFRSLGWYLLTVLLALGLHARDSAVDSFGSSGGESPAFARAMSPALLTAFSSASSNSTLPLTLANVQQRAGVSHRVSSFVLPLGATINMDGTAMYQAVAVLFIGQLYHGFSLPLSQQIIVTFTALLASIGTAGFLMRDW